jgi:DNA-binding MarR family transcriptional regulator
VARPELLKTIEDLDLVEDVELVERALGALFRLSRNFRFHEAVHRRSGFSVDRASYGVLARVGELQPVRLSELAHVLGVDVSTTSRQVATLEQRGLLSRSADPDDGRAVLLDLTRTGQKYLRELSHAWHEFVAEALADWHPREIAAFATMVDRFVVNLAAAADSSPSA